MTTDDVVAAWNTRGPRAVAECHAPDGARVAIAHPETRYPGREALTEHIGGPIMDGGLIRGERVYWDTGVLMASAGLFPG